MLAGLQRSARQRRSSIERCSESDRIDLASVIVDELFGGRLVLVKRLDEEETSAGGIIIPDTAKEKPQEAEVVALGTGGKDDDGNAIEFTVKVGDKVLISKYGGTDVKIDGDDLLIINESDILGVIEG